MIGQTISHYRILSRLGEGGMGVVYLAEDLTLRRQVALKFLPVDLATDSEARTRLIHEAQAAAALLHPHICPIYEVAESDGHAFLAMAYLQGQTLRERLREGPPPLDDALTIARQIGDALAAAHAKGIIHRDVKPANVMLTASGAMLTDFGLAVVSGTSRLTRTGSTVGTAAYLSPEQIQGADADERADVWALGVLLYEMVSGQLPFGGEHEQALFYAILNAEPAALATPARALPAGLDGILAKALAKDRGRRYQKVADLVADLEALAQDRAALPAGRARKKRPRWAVPAAAAVAVVALLAALVALNVAGLRDRLFAGGPRIRSIAVLPLANLSGDSNQEYFADGMTEALINNLGQVSALRVISRTSAMGYKDTKKPLKEIARELRVDAVVEGSVTRSGDRVKISAQLIRAGEERQLWADSFERQISDVLVMQGEIAAAIVGEVKAKLTAEQASRLASAKPVNPEAYQLCLKGRQLLGAATRDAARSAVEAYEQAIAIDTTAAYAYAGLASACHLASILSLAPASELMPKARAAARRALELDPGLSEAYVALATVSEYVGDWAAADRASRRALELNPNSPDALANRGVFLYCVGRYEEAASPFRRLRAQSPTSFWDLLQAGWGLHYSRRFDEAIATFDQARELDPHHPATWMERGAALLMAGRRQEAVAECREAVRRAPEVDYLLACCGWVFARAGESRDAADALAKLRALARKQHVDSYDFAWLYGGAGPDDSTLVWLERAYQERSSQLYTVRADFWLPSLRADPRFKDLLERLGLPPD